MSIFRIRSVERSIQDTDEPAHRLRKERSALDLVVFGIGVTIGAGIFILTGQAAASNAGIACGLAALCYAEFASTVPVAGSAETGVLNLPAALLVAVLTAVIVVGIRLSSRINQGRGRHQGDDRAVRGGGTSLALGPPTTNGNP